MKLSPIARLALLSISLLPLPGGATDHDLAFWKGIIDSGYAVPEGEDAYQLLGELNQLLDSPDPELRDSIGYAIPSAWIYRQKRFTEEQLREQVRALSAKLEHQLGEAADTSVLGRSFSALNLSILVAADLKQAFLAEDDFTQLVQATQHYLLGERDLRGWTKEYGWLHSCAHSADLIKFLGRHDLMVPGPLRAGLLQALGMKFAAPGGHVYMHGKDERMASTLLSFLRREDFDMDEFEAFCAALEAARELDPGPAGQFSAERNAATLNAKNLLRVLLQGLRSGSIPDAVLAEALEQRVLGSLAHLM